ncbi:phosphotriesterase family protein [Cecembia calidifontis]|uniref:Phosphotriesterase-related protein n=1 Tax=Cecembia calidifontis TaxID=1187080 RepID=A0A4Q7PBH4_9BACT|nr:phosphotriesterase [Cecembia calidifontis]RZS96142.1 phosphotriesterase-related protein [Cecembia calidifontis]
MKNFLFLILFLVLFQCCQSPEKKEQYIVHTVAGEIDPQDLGLTLVHEHVLVDFIGADSTGFHRWDKEEVVSFLLPHIREAQDLGVKTIIECTPSFLGKDPELLRMLSEKTGMQFLTNVGYYGAVSGKYLPEHAYQESAEELAKRWISEAQEGIEDTGVKPGFIKISVNEDAVLSDIDAKLVKAAALTHLETGLLIVSHTGPWETAKAQMDVLKSMNVPLKNFVWVHAQNEKDFENYRVAHKEGVWISLDGVVWDVRGHLERLLFLKEKVGLERVLISHDAGWFEPGLADQKNFKGYTSIFDELIPLLYENGFSRADIDLLLTENPKKAFAIRDK